MADVFISYQRNDDDAPVARELAEELERRGYNVWYDYLLRPGDVFDQAIEEELSRAKVVLVLWSKSSIESRWVREEANYAAEMGKIVPVLIDGSKPPLSLNLAQLQDLREWRGGVSDLAILSIIEAIEQIASQPKKT